MDQDLISSQHILRHHQQLERHRLENYKPDAKRKLEETYGFRNGWKEQILSTTTSKWPTFDDIGEDTTATTQIEATRKKEEKNSEKSSYQKNFAYHKVTGKNCFDFFFSIIIS